MPFLYTFFAVCTLFLTFVFSEINVSLEMHCLEMQMHCICLKTKKKMAALKICCTCIDKSQ